MGTRGSSFVSGGLVEPFAEEPAAFTEGAADFAWPLMDGSREAASLGAGVAVPGEGFPEEGLNMVSRE